jgi:hypothetical protein
MEGALSRASISPSTATIHLGSRRSGNLTMLTMPIASL